MSNENKQVKTYEKNFNLRMSRDLWIFLKERSARSEISMTEIILYCVEKYKKKFENKLT